MSLGSMTSGRVCPTCLDAFWRLHDLVEVLQGKVPSERFENPEFPADLSKAIGSSSDSSDWVVD
jgi:hypothetical protein